MSVDRRKKDVQWTVADDQGSITWERVNIAVLMDIRDELKRLNGLLYCENFQAIPRILGRISANTKKPVKRVKK